MTQWMFVESIQPIYLTTKGERFGKRIGPGEGIPHIFKAEPGYAVGAINVKIGDLLNGVTVVYMKMKADGLDVNDAYRSPESAADGGEPTVISGDGAFIVGVRTKCLVADYVVRKGAPTTLGFVTVK